MVEQCSAHTATPLVTHERDGWECVNSLLNVVSKDAAITREERVEQCAARTATPSPDTTLAESDTTGQMPEGNTRPSNKNGSRNYTE